LKRSRNPYRQARMQLKEKEEAGGKNWYLEHDNTYYDFIWEFFINQYRTEDIPSYDYRIIQIFEEAGDRDSLKLDIGCGHGLMSHKLKNTIFADFSKRILTEFWLGEKYSDRVQADVFNLSFKDEIFRVVIASELLEHLENPKRALDEIKRVLQPGGIVLASVPKDKTPGEPGHYFIEVTEEMLKEWFCEFKDLRIETVEPDPWRKWVHYVIFARKEKT